MEADFKDMLVALINEEVDYLLIGAHAMAVHGCPRATGDIDFWVRATPENSRRVHRALTSFGAPTGEITPDYFAKDGPGFQVGLPPLRIDILTKISGVDFEEAWPSRLSHDEEGIPVSVIGRDDLLANKKASGRPKDLSDVRMLEKPPKKRRPPAVSE